MTYSIYINEHGIKFDADHVFTEKDVDEHIRRFFFSASSRGLEEGYTHEDLIQGLFRAMADQYPERMKQLYLEMVQKHSGTVLGMLIANPTYTHCGANWRNYVMYPLFELSMQVLKEVMPDMINSFRENKRQMRILVTRTRWSEGTFKISVVKDNL